jgi:Flp pilus assembly protein TadD
MRITDRPIGTLKLRIALSVTRAAVNLWPDDPNWLSDLGEALIHVEQFDEAKEILSEAFRMDPEDEVTQMRMEMLSEFESEEGELA